MQGNPQARYCFEQQASVGMARFFEDLGGAAQFERCPLIESTAYE
jgi:hypothetical protein